MKRNVLKSGDPGNKKIAKSEFYNELVWLKDLYTPRKTHTNVISRLSPPMSPMDNSLSINNNDDNLESNYAERLPTSKVNKSIRNFTPTVSNNFTSTAKKRSGTSDEVDAVLIKALSKDRSTKNKSENEYEINDPEYAFCMSIIPELKELS